MALNESAADHLSPLSDHVRRDQLQFAPARWLFCLTPAQWRPSDLSQPLVTNLNFMKVWNVRIMRAFTLLCLSQCYTLPLKDLMIGWAVWPQKIAYLFNFRKPRMLSLESEEKMLMSRIHRCIFVMHGGNREGLRVKTCQFKGVVGYCNNWW